MERPENIPSHLSFCTICGRTAGVECRGHCPGGCNDEMQPPIDIVFQEKLREKKEEMNWH